MNNREQSTAGPGAEGFVEIDGEGFYLIPDVDRLGPFLMSIVSDADHWMFVSSKGGLTAGRRDPSLALFPYETDDRLHLASGSTGPVTLIRSTEHAGETTWEPFRGVRTSHVQRNLYKSVVGNQLIFEEVHRGLGLRFRYRWSNSDRFGFVRTATLVNLGSQRVTLDLVDGLLNLLPFGLAPSLYERMSNLTNAYKRSEILGARGRLASYSLEARVVDRPEPAEALIASVAWSVGLDAATVTVDPDAVEVFRAGNEPQTGALTTGRPGAYLLSSRVDIDPGETSSWTIVADVNQTQGSVVELLGMLEEPTDPRGVVERSVDEGTASLVELMARADALQHAGDRMATAHHFSNVMYNVMRGGVFLSANSVDRHDFASFLAGRNRTVAARHQGWIDALPDQVERASLTRRVQAADDPDLMRLFLDYLPLTFSRRHGDPSRPWNAFSIRVRDTTGRPIVYFAGNWRDIFQNWEALCSSFPAYLPSVVSVFLNASTADGYNPYRITRDGIDWEVPEPDDPWSNIGYWGDHQIVYLFRLLDATDRFRPDALAGMLGRVLFSYADVPYRIVPYEDMVRDPKATIIFDRAAADASADRVEDLGGDGKLMATAEGDVYLVTMVEKLLVPALAKLSNFVPGGGIWMNTQRPEWNDANNALVGHGVSMVTLYHLRRYLHHLDALLGGSELTDVAISAEVVDWLRDVAGTLQRNSAHLGGELTAELRRTITDELGQAFSRYRAKVYTAGLTGAVPLSVSDVIHLCQAAVPHLDDTIARNRRPDGLYHSYNLVSFGDDGATARLEHLYEMLEGQVAVLGSGVLTPEEQLGVLEALFDSAMYRPDQNSFMLYPARRLPSFLEKNVIPAAVVAANPLLMDLATAGDASIVLVDADGRHRFNPDFQHVDDLVGALDDLALQERWAELVAAHRQATLAGYEQVFHHRAYTGRSGSMYGYEGIGSIYWHMVAKLLVAAQEAVVSASEEGAPAETLRRLIDLYWRIRSGLGFEKTAAEFGAFPIDAYSHTPAHAGAQQPGMTGQVKEEILTRTLELGLRVDGGRIHFDPVLLRAREFLAEPETWRVRDVGGRPHVIELPAGSLGMSFCQVPVVVALTDDIASIEVRLADGSEVRLPGLQLDKELSRAVFERTGQVVTIRAFIPSSGVKSRYPCDRLAPAPA